MSSHPPPTRPQPRFYLPTSTGTGATVSPSLPSRSRRQSSVHPLSLPSSPGPLRRSPGSLAALRTALQAYHVPDPEPHTPSNYQDPCRAHGHGHAGGSMSTLDLHRKESKGSGLGSDMMDALVEIHRVIYRGKQDLEAEGRILGWNEQGKEVRRVVERWFEGDCVYDHPLVRVSSRQSFLAHLVLLHLLSTLDLPSLTPTALLHNARRLTTYLRNRLAGVDEVESAKGKELEEEWLGIEPGRYEGRAGQGEADEEREGWWRLWDVGADCKEIGGMECYDGCHLAMIEHVLTFTLLPSLAQPRLDKSLAFLPSSISPSFSSLPSYDLPSHSFPRRLFSSLLLEFDSLLHWDLPISTMVEFNEVGKATYLRDVIDVRDVIETFVPFARRIGWLTRRINGILSSTLGGLAMAMLPGPRVEVTSPIRVEAMSKGKWKQDESSSEARLGSAIGLGLHDFSLPMPRPATNVAVRPREPSDESESNSLGLEGVEAGMGMAPDVDDDVLEG